MDENRLRHLIGARVRALREARGLSRFDVSGTSGVGGAGISTTFLADIERGKKTPSLWTLWKIADAIGVKLTDLVDLDGPVPAPRNAKSAREPLGAKIEALAKDVPEDELRRFMALVRWFFRPQKKPRNKRPKK